jgi:hypothetical protein
MRHSVRNMRVKDLPQPGQRWRYQGDLVLINFIGASQPSCAWVVTWTYIDAEGKAIFRRNLGQGPSVLCDGSIELGRFLHKAKKVV